MTIKHNHYLELAFQLAETNLGKTKLNPSVGALVVKNNTVISSGVTSLNGRPHAEFNALKNLNNCTGASLYTTLEPCTHKGITPPCTNIIIQKKIKEVYYAFEDPDERTYKKAKKTLNSNGIKTKLIKNIKNSNFYKSYFLNKKFSIPYVSAKIAMSKDFFTINKKGKWITNPTSRKIVHLIRSRHDCILTTSKTVNYDDSLLNCRIDGLNNNRPDLFIIDLKLKLKTRLSLNNLIKVRKTYLITSNDNFKKALVYKKMGYKIMFINSLKNKKDIYQLYEKIYKTGYARILIETGLKFLNHFLEKKAINELYIFKSNNKLGKNGKNNVTSKYLKNISAKPLTINLDGDKLIKKEF